MQTRHLYLPLALLCVCAPGAPAQGTASRWSFAIEQRYGERPGTELLSAQTIGVDGAGRLYVADSRPAAVKVFSPDGRGPTSRIPEAMRRERADSAVAELGKLVGVEVARQAVRLSDVPTEAPAFTRLLIDEDGNIWARQLSGTDDSRTAFHIFGPNGADLGNAVLPARVPDWGGVAFGRGTIFVRTDNADGQPIILRIRVARSG